MRASGAGARMQLVRSWGRPAAPALAPSADLHKPQPPRCSLMRAISATNADLHAQTGVYLPETPPFLCPSWLLPAGTRLPALEQDQVAYRSLKTETIYCCVASKQQREGGLANDLGSSRYVFAVFSSNTIFMICATAIKLCADQGPAASSMMTPALAARTCLAEVQGGRARRLQGAARPSPRP